MRITGSQVGSVASTQLEKIKKTAPTTSTETVRSADQIVLSDDVSAVQAAREAIANAPDVRQDKVDMIRREIQDGTYQIAPERIAEKILAEIRLAKLSRE